MQPLMPGFGGTTPMVPFLPVSLTLMEKAPLAVSLMITLLTATLVALAVLVLVRTVGVPRRPEGLAGAAGALRQARTSGWSGGRRSRRFEDGSTGAAGESRVPDQGIAAPLLLGRALDLRLVGRHPGSGPSRSTTCQGWSGYRRRRGPRRTDSPGQRHELRKLSHVVPSLVCSGRGRLRGNSNYSSAEAPIVSKHPLSRKLHYACLNFSGQVFRRAARSEIEVRAAASSGSFQ